MAAVFGAIVVLVLAVWFAMRRLQQRRRCAALHLAVSQIRLLRQLIEQVQRHRGLLYGVLSGEGSLEARRWSVNQQVNQLLETCRLHQPTLHRYGTWHAVLACWAQLEEGDDQADPEQMLLAHNEMIRNLLATVAALADR